MNVRKAASLSSGKIADTLSSATSSRFDQLIEFSHDDTENVINLI